MPGGWKYDAGPMPDPAQPATASADLPPGESLSRNGGKAYHVLAWLSISVALSMTGASFALAFAAPTAFRELCREDRVIEWAGVVALTLAGLLAMALFIGLRLKTGAWRVRQRWFYLFAFAFCLWGAAEEISYGQRVLEFETPESLVDLNIQREVNIHNMVQEIVFNVKTKHIAGVTFLVYGVIVPLLIRHGKSSPSGARWIYLPFPPYYLVPLWLCGLVLVVDQPTGWEEEIAESLYAVGLLSFVMFEGMRLFAPSRVPADATPPTGPLQTDTSGSSLTPHPHHPHHLTRPGLRESNTMGASAGAPEAGSA